jgi:[acyl-carrier-protein] S-malonyltransferase
MLAFLFPGQGTLRVGMGAGLRRDPVGAAVFRQAAALLPMDVTALCTRGPESALIATENAQPAVTVCNLAALGVLRDRGLAPDIVAGHSVGELTALYAAGALTLPEVLRLVTVRARLMAAAGPPGGMSAVLGLAVGDVERLAAEAQAPGEPLVLALENASEQSVVSGAAPALARFATLAMAAGARKVSPLAVGGAFHSPLMAGAVEAWADVVRQAVIGPPTCPVIPNVTAEPTTDPATLRAALAEQIVGRVRWARTMRRLTESGVTDCVEVGDSKALAALVRATGTGLRCSGYADVAAHASHNARAVGAP